MADNLSLKSFVVLMKASKIVQERAKKDINKHDMHMSEFMVLEALYSKGKQTVRQISDAVLINSGSITYVMDKLVAKGLLERIDCKEDRRVVYIQITEKGKSLMDGIFPQHQLVIEDIFSCISDQEKEVFIDLLKRVGKKE